MKPEITIGTATAAPGEKGWGTLTVRAAGREATLPVCIVNGRGEGVHAVAIGSQHGRERNGMEAIRRFCEALDPDTLAGSLAAFPCANPLAVRGGAEVFVERTLTTEEEGKGSYHTDLNMNFNWPGAPDTSLVAAAVHAIWTQGITAPGRKAALVVDLHGHANPTAVYAQNRRIARLGVAAGIRHVVLTGEDEIASCNRACAAAGIVSMTIELEGKDLVFPASVADGMTALRNLLILYGMTPGTLELPDRAWIHNPWRDHLQPQDAGTEPSFVICPAQHDGVVVEHRRIYETVRKGDLICELVDPHTARVVERCLAPMDGSIYGYRTPKPGFATAGERLVVVGLLEVHDPAADTAALRREDFLHVEQER